MSQIITKIRASAIIYDVIKSSKEGKVWLLPANCCPIVPLTFLKGGVKFDFIDLDTETLCMNKTGLFQKLKQNPKKYSGLLYADTYGTAANPNSFFSQIKTEFSDLTIIHDKCQSLPDMTHTENADITLYSTGYAKCIDLSMGGYAIINERVNYKSQTPLSYKESDLKEITLAYKKAFEGEKSRFHYTDTLWLDNSALHTSPENYFQTIESVKPKIIAQKEKMNLIYSSAIPEEIQMKKDFQFWRFNILVPNKKELLDSLFAKKLFASSHYPSSGKVFSEQEYDYAELLHKHIVNLFNDFYIKEEQALQICAVVNEHYSKYGAIPSQSPLQKVLNN